MFIIWYCRELANDESYIRSMDLLSLFKDENFKNLLFNSLITGWSLENLPYLSSCSLWQWCRFWRIRSKVSPGIKSDITCKKVMEGAERGEGSLPIPFTVWKLIAPTKNKRNVSLVFLKQVYVGFLSMTVQLGVANNNIN